MTVNFLGGFMKIPRPQIEQDQNSTNVVRQSILNNDSLERQNLEMKRRFEGLQVRRVHLERELQAVKNCLLSLDQQIKHHKAFQKLLIRN